MRGFYGLAVGFALALSAGTSQAQTRTYDLSVSDVQATQETRVGDTITVSAIIHSSGNQVTNFNWSVYLTINGALQGATRLADFGPTSIPAQGNLNVQEQVSLPSVVTGRHRLAIVVDADNLIPERNEYDNIGIASDYTRIRARLADLSISPVRLDLRQTQAGQSINATYRVDNLGTADATFNVTAHMSGNPSISTDDREIGRTRLTLAAGQSAHETMQLNLPNDISAGDYHIAMIADPESVVSELQESNNIGLATESLNINSSELSILNTDLPSGTVFIDYFARINAVGGDGHIQYTVSTGRLPRGLQLNSSTGVISGEPTESGHLMFTVMAQSNGLLAEVDLSIQTAPSGIDLVITTPSLGIGTISLPFQIELTAAGGEPPYTWRLNDGALPQGIDLNSSGWLSGIPQVEGKYTVSLIVEDGLGALDTAEYDFRIQSPNVTITTERVPDVILNRMTEFALEASGGRAPYVWIAKSRLPAGMSLSETGILSGIPNQIGTHAFRVQVIDASEAGGKDTALFHMKVLDEGIFRIVEAPVDQILTRAKLSYVLRTEGGQGILNWKLEPGDRLPDGFQLVPSETAPTREMVLQGSSFQPLTHGFGVQVEDETGRVRKAALVIQVNAPELGSVEGCRCVLSEQETKSQTGLGLILLLGLFVFRRSKSKA